MNLQEVRQKYPQYGDLSDQQLADALHSKFYSDIPKEQFYSKIGIAATQAQQPAAQAPLTAPTTGERGQAALGGVNRGLSGLLGIPVDTVENVVNLGIAGVGTAATALGRPDLAPDPIKGSVGGSEWIRGKMEGAGIGTSNPRPDDPASRMLHTAGVIGGGSVVPGASVKGVLTAAAGGAIAGEALGPEYVGVGALVPAAAAQGAAAVKNAVAARTAPNVETFRQAGATPSVGQATDSIFFRGLENLAAKFPGGSGVIRKFVENQQASFGEQARTGVSAEAAGRTIEKGITGSGGFIERTRQTWQSLDDALGARVGSDYRFAPNNTLKALDDLVEPVLGAERTTRALVNPKIAEIRESFRADAVNNLGGMPFEAIRALRSRVGAMLDDALVSGVPGGELKKLYGALSKDLEAGAKAIGAGKEFARQNDFYRSRMDRIESVLDRVVGKSSQPEEIFKRFMPSDPDQAGKVRAVMRSLDPSERKIVTDAVVNRLGRATPGRQDEVGSIFSSETFLTNWNRLSSSAKAQLFPDDAARNSMEKIAKAAAAIRSGSGVYANPSGTTGAAAAYSVYVSPIAAIATGSIAPAAAAAGAVGAAHIGARMLTSPKVVEWLATPVSPTKPGAAAEHLARLAVIYNSSNDEDLRGELRDFLTDVSGSPEMYWESGGGKRLMDLYWESGGGKRLMDLPAAPPAMAIEPRILDGATSWVASQAGDGRILNPERLARALEKTAPQLRQDVITELIRQGRVPHPDALPTKQQEEAAPVQQRAPESFVDRLVREGEDRNKAFFEERHKAFLDSLPTRKKHPTSDDEIKNKARRYLKLIQELMDEEEAK